MAHVVGVPKREPCKQCGLPVFFAERLAVDGSFYHRKCLRCARCGSQLTPGSFYETEVDGVFCCETCPDEEKKLRLNNNNDQDGKPSHTDTDARQSFSATLAMFQTNGKGLLQKSLSDEEKSKSLKRLTELYSNNIKPTKDECEDAQSDDAANDMPAKIESSSSDDSDDEDDEPAKRSQASVTPASRTSDEISKPKLPPKANVLNKLYGKTSAATVTPSTSHDTVSDPSANERKSSQIEVNSANEESPTPETNSNAEKLNSIESHRNCLPLDAFTNVTKETSIEASQTAAVPQDHTTENGKNVTEQPIHLSMDNESAECERTKNEQEIERQCSGDDNSIDTHKTNASKLEQMTDIREPSSSISDNDSQKMVRSRLSHFEALVQSSDNNNVIAHHSPRLNSAQTVTTEQMEQSTAMEGPAADVIEQLHLPIDQMSLNDDNEDNGHSSAITDETKILNTKDQAENDLDVLKPVPRQRATLMRLDSNNLAAQPPMPLKRRQKPEPLSDKHQDETNAEPAADSSLSSGDNEKKRNKQLYPTRLNPFGSDDEDDRPNLQAERKSGAADNLNPFDSSDDEIELLKDATPTKAPNHRASTNPFGSDTENDTDADSIASKRTPIPTPRKPINGSFQATPDISPRMSHTLHPRLRAGDDLCESNASLASALSYNRASSTLVRSSQIHGSMSSLASSTLRHKKGRAPEIPTKLSTSANSSPSQSVRATPISRKKRLAPLPPKALPSLKSYSIDGIHMLDDSLSSHTESIVDLESSKNIMTSPESNYVTSSNGMSMSSAEPANSGDYKSFSDQTESTPIKSADSSQRKLIPVDQSLLNDLADMPAEEKIVYRRKIMPDQVITPIKNSLTDRQCEKMKENKESQNKNRQSQIVSNVLEDASQVYSPNKSSYGKWKRRKGPAPSLPVPPRKVIQMLPLQEIRHELEVIEVQQQGLEKQGVTLEKMIRERCEGGDNENTPLTECKPNSKEAEDLILQLFELVNEKNELFRRQAELMYLRRQHRLEQEQADIEYEIRVLMAQPECNKTDSDKAREEALISRLVEVVQLRNAVIESLEMDRIREAEEDQSIKESLELHTAKRDEELCQQTPIKLSKKEKKKQKESKKLAKQKKMDADKDADDTEISEAEKSKEKKKKKKFLF